MILVNLSEETLYNAFYEILNYFRSKSDELETYQGENNNGKFLNLLNNEIYTHYEQILKNFDNSLINLYKKEVCIEIDQDGKVELNQQIFNVYDFKSFFLNLYKRYRNYEYLKTLRRLLLSRTCIKEILEKNPAIEVSNELVGSENDGKEINKYVLYCYVDDNFLPIKDDVIKPHIIRCFNQIKERVEQFKKEQKRKPFDTIIESSITAIKNGKFGDFSKVFSRKFIGENYSKDQQGYDMVAGLVFNLLGNLMGKLSEYGSSEKYSFRANELLFNWLLGRSLVYEIYVFRKLVDSGIPCAFHFELKDKKGELDLVYCTESGVGVVEVKSSRFNKDIDEKIELLLKDKVINKYVVIHSSEVSLDLESDTKLENVITMKFEELSEVTRLAQLVKGL